MITTTTPHGFFVGESVTIAGNSVGGYAGTFLITSVPSPTSFTYQNNNNNIGESTGGTATVGSPATNTISATTTANSLTLTGTILGSGNVVKSGVGNLVLQADDIYSGSTTVAQGALTLNNGGVLSQSGTGYTTETATTFTALTAGTFTLTFNGQTTVPDTLQRHRSPDSGRALAALSTVGGLSNVTVPTFTTTSLIVTFITTTSA